MPIYILRAGETPYVKIGWAEGDPEQRRADLQTGCWEELRIVRVIDGPRSAEGWLHRYFREHSVRGEWFRFHPQMLTVSVHLMPNTGIDADGVTLAAVETFLAATGMTPTVFGRRVLGDPTFVHELRNGRECRRATRTRIFDFIRSATPTQDAAA